MTKYLAILVLMLAGLTVNAQSDSTVIGGGGFCYTDMDPNNVRGLEKQSLRECRFVLDTLTGVIYKYRGDTTSGNRWGVLTLGGDGSATDNLKFFSDRQELLETDLELKDGEQVYILSTNEIYEVRDKELQWVEVDTNNVIPIGSQWAVKIKDVHEDYNGLFPANSDNVVVDGLEYFTTTHKLLPYRRNVSLNKLVPKEGFDNDDYIGVFVRKVKSYDSYNLLDETEDGFATNVTSDAEYNLPSINGRENAIKLYGHGGGISFYYNEPSPTVSDSLFISFYMKKGVGVDMTGNSVVLAPRSDSNSGKTFNNFSDEFVEYRYATKTDGGLSNYFSVNTNGLDASDTIYVCNPQITTVGFKPFQPRREDLDSNYTYLVTKGLDLENKVLNLRETPRPSGYESDADYINEAIDFCATTGLCHTVIIPQTVALTSGLKLPENMTLSGGDKSWIGFERDGPFNWTEVYIDTFFTEEPVIEFTNDGDVYTSSTVLKNMFFKVRTDLNEVVRTNSGINQIIRGIGVSVEDGYKANRGITLNDPLEAGGLFNQIENIRISGVDTAIMSLTNGGSTYMDNVQMYGGVIGYYGGNKLIMNNCLIEDMTEGYAHFTGGNIRIYNLESERIGDANSQSLFKVYDCNNFSLQSSELRINGEGVDTLFDIKNTTSSYIANNRINNITEVPIYIDSLSNSISYIGQMNGFYEDCIIKSDHFYFDLLDGSRQSKSKFVQSEHENLYSDNYEFKSGVLIDTLRSSGLIVSSTKNLYKNSKFFPQTGPSNFGNPLQFFSTHTDVLSNSAVDRNGENKAHLIYVQDSPISIVQNDEENGLKENTYYTFSFWMNQDVTEDKSETEITSTVNVKRFSNNLYDTVQGGWQKIYLTYTFTEAASFSLEGFTVGDTVLIDDVQLTQSKYPLDFAETEGTFYDDVNWYVNDTFTWNIKGNVKINNTEFNTGDGSVRTIYNPNSMPILSRHYREVNAQSGTIEDVNNSAQIISRILNTTLSSGRNAYQDATLVFSPDAYIEDIIYTQKGENLDYIGNATTRTNSQGGSVAVATNVPSLDFSKNAQIGGVNLNANRYSINDNVNELDVSVGSIFFEVGVDDTITSDLFQLDIVTSDTTKAADFGSGAVAAYSLEPITSGYTGDVIEVTRSSDNSTQLFDSTEIADGTLATFVGTGNIGYVTTFIDQIDTFDLVQTDTADAMIIYRGDSLVTRNGKPAMYANGGFFRDNNELQTSGLTNSTILIAEIIPPGTAFENFFGTYDQTGDFIFCGTAASQNNLNLNINSPTVWVNGYDTLINDEVFIFILQVNLSNTKARYNGKVKGSVSTPSDFNYDGVTLFAAPIGFPSADDRTPTGYVQEFIIYNEDVNSFVSALENNINDRYDLTNNIQPLAADSLFIYKSVDSVYAAISTDTVGVSSFLTDENIRVGFGYEGSNITLYGNDGVKKTLSPTFTQAYNQYSIKPSQPLWLYELLMFDFKLEDEEIKTLTEN